jgi:hypothetical protein
MYKVVTASKSFETGKIQKLKEKNIFLFKTKNEKKFLDSIELFITWNGGR